MPVVEIYIGYDMALRAYSITTRIKTYETLHKYLDYHLLIEHILSQQGLRRTDADFYAPYRRHRLIEHIPSQQGLRQEELISDLP